MADADTLKIAAARGGDQEAYRVLVQRPVDTGAE